MRTTFNSIIRSRTDTIAARLTPGSIRRSLPARRHAWAASVALALSSSLAVGVGCMPHAPAASLASGERPTTGVPRFDRLFSDIHAARTAVEEARTEEIDARGALARRLGLAESTPIDVLGARLRERTTRLSQDGLTLELEFTGIEDVDMVDTHPDANAEAVAGTDVGAAEDGAEDAALSAPPTATLRTPSREPQRRELRLLEALAQAALSGATVYANMGRERRRTERLLGEIAELEARVDSSFVDAADRERVRAKLSEAKQFLPQLGAQATDVAGSADILISLLDEAANTAPVQPTRRRPGGPPREIQGVPRTAPPPAPVAPGGTPKPPPVPPPATPGVAAPARPEAPAPSGANPPVPREAPPASKPPAPVPPAPTPPRAVPAPAPPPASAPRPAPPSPSASSPAP